MARVVFKPDEGARRHDLNLFGSETTAAIGLTQYWGLLVVLSEGTSTPQMYFNHP
jgi:hypothetical protein